MRAALWVAAGLAGTAAPAAAELRFERVFATAGEPARAHYLVDYRAGGTAHRLEVWREGDARVKRVTDGAIATFATHRPGDAGYTMVVLDRRRRISTRIDRTNLYRIGQFTDWFDLAHGLRHPKGAYRLTAGTAPAGLARSAALCGWYDLTQSARTTHVCWSRAERLPLLIVSEAGLEWRVTAIDHRAVPAAAFVPDDRGYLRNNANQDIERD